MRDFSRRKHFIFLLQFTSKWNPNGSVKGLRSEVASLSRMCHTIPRRSSINLLLIYPIVPGNPEEWEKSSRKWRFWGCSWMRTCPVPTFGMLTEKISLKAIRIVCSYHNKYFRPVTLHSGTTPEALFSCDLEANGRRINNEISLFPLAPSSPSTWSLRSRALQQQQHASIPRVGHQV